MPLSCTSISQGIIIRPGIVALPLGMHSVLFITILLFLGFIVAQESYDTSDSVNLDPALNAEHDEVWVYGLRMRMSFQEPVVLWCS